MLVKNIGFEKANYRVIFAHNKIKNGNKSKYTELYSKHCTWYFRHFPPCRDIKNPRKKNAGTVHCTVHCKKGLQICISPNLSLYSIILYRGAYLWKLHFWKLPQNSHFPLNLSLPDSQMSRTL